MNFMPNYNVKDFHGSIIPNASPKGGVSEPQKNKYHESEAEQRAALVAWLTSILPNLSLPVRISEEELRTCLINGTVFCQILNTLRPGIVVEDGAPASASEFPSGNVRSFLAAMDEMRLPRFEISDLEQGSMKPVIECLLTLKVQFMPGVGNNVPINSLFAKSGKFTSDQDDPYSPRRFPTLSGEERQNFVSDSRFQRSLRNSTVSEPSTALAHHAGHKFHEVFQLKQGCYADIPAAKISEMMKSNSLDNAPTQSLLSIVNGILDQNVERKSGEIPHRVACLLRKVVQEIERRISTQADHLRTQNNLFKARVEKYESRIRVLEALANGTSAETQMVMNKLQRVTTQKTKIDEQKKFEDPDADKLMKEKEHYNREISNLKQELGTTRSTYEERYLQVEAAADKSKAELEGSLKELEFLLKDSRDKVKELEAYSETKCQKWEERYLQVEAAAEKTKVELEGRLKELEFLLKNSCDTVKELEAYSETKCQKWDKKEHVYKSFINFQIEALNELRFASESIKQNILSTRRSCSEDFNCLGVKLKALEVASENYHEVLAENRKLFNEVQELKGNIRVYCRIRPFLPGQAAKQTTIEHIGDNGELVFANPSKSGKDVRRLFRFNKVFGSASTQAEVFSDVQPLVCSVLDGYNVCIFAYGQTGSGKTYTMTGPVGASKEDWGVNYRALNDLFQSAHSRRSSFTYGVSVQMVEIYNEQVRDLLSSEGNQKKLGIMTTSQPNGLAVPDASIHSVKSTSHVLELMDFGQRNRAVGATAMNIRSSRSHSVVTVHVRGMDEKSGATFRGNLHLVDLAGSERVDRSEASGDRLKEAQHINKSLSALGDVIFALAQKNSHVPYRNSKLTQVLQSSLGGQAKTLMFVQLNPDLDSYYESLSTLKFAERVSGVELGAARSSKEGRDVRELMEQVACLKDTIAIKDEEIARLQLLKPNANGERLMRRHESSPNIHDSCGLPQQRSEKLSNRKSLRLSEKANRSNPSDEHSEDDSYFKQHNEGQNLSADVEIVGSGDADSEERLSDVSDGGLSVGTETDGSADAISLSGTGKLKSAMPKLPRPQKQGQAESFSMDEFMKVATSLKKSSPAKSSKRWQ